MTLNKQYMMNEIDQQLPQKLFLGCAKNGWDIA